MTLHSNLQWSAITGVMCCVFVRRQTAGVDYSILVVKAQKHGFISQCFGKIKYVWNTEIFLNHGKPWLHRFVYNYTMMMF